VYTHATGLARDRALEAVNGYPTQLLTAAPRLRAALASGPISAELRLNVACNPVLLIVGSLPTERRLRVYGFAVRPRKQWRQMEMRIAGPRRPMPERRSDQPARSLRWTCS
jgi:hypothetical protein